MTEVRSDFGSMLAPSLLSSALSEHTTPNTKTNTVSFHHKHFRFIVAFIEYIFPTVEKTCLEDFKSFRKFKWEKGTDSLVSSGVV